MLWLSTSLFFRNPPRAAAVLHVDVDNRMCKGWGRSSIQRGWRPALKEDQISAFVAMSVEGTWHNQVFVFVSDMPEKPFQSRYKWVALFQWACAKLACKVACEGETTRPGFISSPALWPRAILSVPAPLACFTSLHCELLRSGPFPLWF